MKEFGIKLIGEEIRQIDKYREEVKMGCGCGKNKNLLARRPARPSRNLTGPQKNKVLRTLNKPIPKVDNQNPVVQERRAKEKVRRDAILKALNRPS